MSASTTTLMTFKVRTPPTTLSVKLYGSWDNFTNAYPMSRDIRLGAEHWSGCHSFENITNDGDMRGLNTSRNGGLKMGGTYWYYYQLDDEIDFHNSAEPSTTRCPLLPGQLVNVLQVPFALSGSRKRDASVSSTSSEHRTMDPDAKFMNPRPAPPPSRQVRLNTSPTLLQSPVIVSSPSGPASAAPIMRTTNEDDFLSSSSRIFLLPRKPSLDALLKTTSSRPNPAGMRQAVKPSQPDVSETSYRDIINWIPARQPTLATESNQSTSQSESPEAARADRSGRPRPPPGALLLRSNSDEAITLSSFGEHRRQRSRSRSRGGSARNSIALEESAHLELNTRRVAEPAPLSTLLEVNSPEPTPGYGPTTGRRMALEALEGRNEGELLLEKRLPTLPNTPSSAYPPSLKGNSPPRKTASQFLGLDSHFSTTTIDTTCHLNSMIMDEPQTDSSWWMREAEKSPTSEPTFDESIDSPTLGDQHSYLMVRPVSLGTTGQTEITDDDEESPRIMSSVVNCTTITSATSTTPSISCGDSDIIEVNDFSETTSLRSSRSQLSPFQHYSLPEYENASEVTIKRYNMSNNNLIENGRPGVGTESTDQNKTLSHSEGMQQLLDELSYLSTFIQN